MLLSELLAASGLGLRVLHEAPGARERPVGRVVTTDLLEPGRYLTGGELVLTGLVWRRDPGDSERFVASVAGSGATTLLAGDALLGSVPDDLLDACRRHAVTLVEVPTEVAFADIAEHVAAAESAASGERQSASLARQRRLLSAIAAGRSLDELLARVASEIAHPCRVVTPSGRHVVAGPGELDDDVLDVLAHRFLTADRLPTVAEAGGAPYSLFPVGPGPGNRLGAWVLVAEGDHRAWPAEHVEVVHELCAIAALDRSRRDERLRALRPIAEEAVALLRAGAPHAEIAARLRQAGLDPGRPLVAAVAEVRGDGAMEEAVALLEDVALGVGTPVVAADREGRAVALLPAVPGLADLLRTGFGRLAAGLGRGVISVGISEEAGIEALSGALEEAQFAHRVASRASAPVTVVGSDEVTSHVLLLASLPDDVRRSYAQRVLGAVLEHDRRTGAELLPTLAAFLECSGSWARTAEALHLHVNTVRYRLERVQELIGRDLSRLEDRVDVFLALRSLQPRPAAGGPAPRRTRSGPGDVLRPDRHPVQPEPGGLSDGRGDRRA